MNLSDLSIRRPVFAAMLVIGLVVFIPYKLGDTKAETQSLMEQNVLG